MHPKVTNAIIKSYRDVGIAHVPGAVSPQWVAGMTGVIDKAVGGLRANTLEFPPDDKFRPVEFEDHDGYTRVISLYWRLPEMRKLVEQSECPDIVADVIGADTLQPWMDGTFLKEGDAPETATPWHNDECLFPLSGEHSPSMWIALTDIARDNAPLQTLAGSNKDSHRYLSSWAITKTPPPGFHPWDELLARVAAPGADIRVWDVKAGDMLVIHPKTIHGSLPRTAKVKGRRAAFSLRWIGSDIRYQPNPTAKGSPFENHPQIKPGEPIPEAIMPIVWRRTRAA